MTRRSYQPYGRRQERLEGTRAARERLEERQRQADAGYRSEATFEQLRDHPTELIVALGREGKKQVAIDPLRRPHTADMAEKFQQP